MFLASDRFNIEWRPGLATLSGDREWRPWLAKTYNTVLEPGGRDVSKSIWLERARARGQETLDGSYPSERARRARSSQMAFSRVCLGDGNCERLADMVAQGALNVIDTYIYIYRSIYVYRERDGEREREREREYNKIHMYTNVYIYTLVHI